MRLLTDDDVRHLLTPATAAAVMAGALRLHAAGGLAAPPRWSVPSHGGRLVFTVGGATSEPGPVGFRAYHTAPDAGDQLVAVFDGDSGALRGLVAGTLLGAMRTAAINAVALEHMARRDASVLGVLGSGRQAHAHARAALAVRTFEQVLVFGRDPGRRRAFAASLAEDTGVPCRAADDPELVVRAADVLITATTSRRPVLEAGWLRPGTHVNTIGPKARGASELPPAVGTLAACIATDAPAQIDAYPEPFFLADEDRARMVSLGHIVAGELPGRGTDDELTLFCSAGLAGTEVLLADALLDLAEGAPAAAAVAAGAARSAVEVRLAPVAPAELEPYLERLVPEYAADHVRVGNWPAEGAEARARAQVAELLPQGVATPGHALFHVQDASGVTVGTLWLATHSSRTGAVEAFVYDLEIDPAHRRKGFASAALREAAAWARRQGARQLALHVFGDNAAARRLYRSLGFEEAGVHMVMALD